MGNPFWNPYQRGKLKFAAAGLVAAIPGSALLFLLYQVFGQIQSWMWYVSGFLFYTIFVFGYAYIDDNSTLFSEKDSRSKSKLTVVHLNYLAVLLFVAVTASYVKPLLPASMVTASRKDPSWFEVIVFAAVAVIFFVEESWLSAKGQQAKSVNDEENVRA
jgi:uncharacterized membrane protein